MGRSSSRCCGLESSWREGGESLPWRSRGWEPMLLREVKRRNPSRRPIASPITRPRRAMVRFQVGGSWKWECVEARAGILRGR